MRQEHFEKNFEQIWRRFDEMAERLQSPSAKRPAEDAYAFPALYRKICNHYALSLSRRYSPALVSRLHGRVLLGHQILYQRSGLHISQITRFFSQTFPSVFRETISCFWIALLLFVLPFMGTAAGCYFQRDLIYSIMEDEQVAQMEFSYDPANENLGRAQDKQQDARIAMFGFYIRNNISIGFRTFAGGILAGAGTVFFLVFNGIFLGAVSGHITRIGFTETFWPFVSGHGAFELTAIVISGAAGLVIARAVIAPGNARRTDALKEAGAKAARLVMGAAAMLVLAAFIEAFWSPAGLRADIKYAAATVFWTSVILYLALAGRGGPKSREAGKGCPQ